MFQLNFGQHFFFFLFHSVSLVNPSVTFSLRFFHCLFRFCIILFTNINSPLIKTINETKRNRNKNNFYPVFEHTKGFGIAMGIKSYEKGKKYPFFLLSLGLPLSLSVRIQFSFSHSLSFPLVLKEAQPPTHFYMLCFYLSYSFAFCTYVIVNV